MTVYPLQDSFSKGEISPKLRGRPSLDLYRSGLAQCVNFDVQPQGGLRKRFGTRYVAEAMTALGDVRLLPFEPESDNTYVIEMDPTHLRTLRDGEVQSAVSEVGLVQEPKIAHNFTDIENLKYEQSNDVMWMVDGTRGKQLTRQDTNLWTLEDIEFLDGPFDNQNTDKTRTIQASATNGSVTLTATGFTFAPEIVGSVIRLEEQDRLYAPTWINDGTNAVGDQRRYAGNVYEVVTAHSGGANVSPPTHTIGTEALDASGLREYKYLHSGHAFVKVTAFNSTTELQVEVLSSRPYEDQPDGYIPQDIVTTGSYLWSLPMFFEGSGPTAVTLYQERLVFAKGNRVFMSRIGNFKSHRAGTNPDDAVTVEATSSTYNEIYSLTEVNGYLLAIGKGGVQRFSASTDGVIAPDDIFQRSVKRKSMGKMQPLKTDDSLFLFPYPAHSVYEATYSTEQGGFLTPDAAIMSDHLFKYYGAATDGAVSRGTTQQCLFPTNKGAVICLAYDKYQQFSGWSRRYMGGAVRAVASVSGKYGPEDYYVIDRTVGSDTVRTVEYIKNIEGQEYTGFNSVSIDEAGFGGLDELAGPIAPGLITPERLVEEVPIHLDCAFKWDDLVPFVAGTEMIWCNGTHTGRAVVQPDGSLVGPPAASWVGFNFTAQATTLALELGLKGDGATSGRQQRVSRVVVDTINSAAVEAVSDGLSTYVTGERDTDFSAGLAGDAIELKDGYFESSLSTGWGKNGKVTIRSTQPFPAYIRNLTPVVD